jgi:hypothetical protein
VPNTIHVEPIIGQYFSARDFLANSIHKNFGSATRQTAQTCRFQALQNDFQRLLADFREVMDLGRTETVNVDARKSSLNVGKQLFVPFERQFRMQTALHQNLVAAERHGFFNLTI